MLGSSLFSYLTSTSPSFPELSLPSQKLAPNPADLDFALRRAPTDKLPELQALCHWLVCCKNLWPAAEAEWHAGINAPFSLHQHNQSLRADPHCVLGVVCTIVDSYDADMMNDILRYVHASGEDHWQALREQHHPATSIDPAGPPRKWPRECRTWAIRTMNMHGADLSFTNFSGADMRYIELSEADLQYSCLDDALLQGADLRDANAEDATFRRADMSNADLRGLTFSANKNNLGGANFNGANLDDFALDIHPYEPGADGAYALRKGLLPATIDHLIRHNLREDFRAQDSDDSDYLADFSDDESKDSEIGAGAKALA